MRATPTQELLRLGFTDAGRAQQLLGDPVLADVVARAEEAGASLPAALGEVPDPDLALLTLLRLVEAAADDDGVTTAPASSRREPDPAHRDGDSGNGCQNGPDGGVDLARILTADTEHRRRLLAVLGASSALGDMLVARPRDVGLLADEHVDGILDLPPEEERRRALEAVGADPGAAVPVATVTGTEGAAPRWEVTLAHHDGRRWRVTVAEGASHPPRPESCGGTPAAPRRMDVVAVRQL